MQGNMTFYIRQHAVSERQPFEGFRRGSRIDVQQWSVLIGLPLVGLFALVFLLSLGGVFALVGPWVLFLGITRAVKILDQNTVTSSKNVYRPKNT